MKINSLLVFMLLVGLSLPGYAEEAAVSEPTMGTPTHRVNVGALRVRFTPDADARVRGVVYRGAGLEVINSQGDWSEINYSDEGVARTGWVSSSLIVPASTSGVAPTPAIQMGRPTHRVNVGALRVRFNPDADAGVCGVVYRGAGLEVINSEGDWSEIHYHDEGVIRTGWVSSSFIVATSTFSGVAPVAAVAPVTAKTAPAIQMGHPTHHVNVDALRVRFTPDADARIRGVVYRGAGLEVFNSQGDWSEIHYHDEGVIRTGWVASSFIVPASDSPARVAATAEPKPVVAPAAPERVTAPETVTVPAAPESVTAPATPEPVAAAADDPCPVPVEVPRRRPGVPVLRYRSQCDPTAVGPAEPNHLVDFVPVPDRWRIVNALGYPERLLDPYGPSNPLKGDKPVFGEDWFFNMSLIADSVLEPRRFPVPVGSQTTDRPGSIDLIGSGDQFIYNQNLIMEFVLYKGDTVFKPPDYEFRFTPVFNYSAVSVDERGVLKADPRSGTDRREGFVSVQELFIDKHLRNVSERYDFDSIRIGIQPFSTDFRGFLFQDIQFGVRLFGNRRNNVFQYNLAWFRRLEKDANSGLNDITERSFSDSLRDDDIFLFNVYWQDFPRLGFFSQGTVVYNRNREQGDILYEDNGFIQRPASLGIERTRDYDVTYLGYNGDGHFGRFNLTASAYYAFGKESRSSFINHESDIRAWFLATEGSVDLDWVRLRGSFLYATGDSDPYDDKSEGYDAIFENPIFAGADTSFWIRQPVPLIGGGRVSLSNRNGVLNSLRSSKEFGQSNFTNPGTILLGAGADFDLTPQLRVSFNVNQLWFDETRTVEVARNQGPVDSDIGQDVSLAIIYRPFATQNIVLRMSAAAMFPGQGFKDLFGDETPYSILGNFLFTY
ncbi:MAG: SH3 domain-containing protein [Gammaproteobacteria bacterium]|nr:SH3 domain-containing protein [Gammaproteobacteria bacterium]